LALKQLPHIFAASATRDQGVPPVGAFTTRCLTVFNLQFLTGVQYTFKDSIESLLTQLAVYADAEFTGESAY
jgi:hypothetical protein